MLADSDGDVLILPATTRYESPGGGTETSTERRIIFSPEIPGPRIGSARPEWQVFGEVVRARAAGAARTGCGLDDAAAIRREIERDVPLYAGIERASAKGRAVPVGRAAALRRRPVRHARRPGALRAGRPARAAARPAGEFFVSTRRGKQFNSMVQREVDPLTGAAPRRHPDQRRTTATAWACAPGARVRLRSARGTFDGALRVAPIRDGNLEVHWPEGNVLLTGAAARSRVARAGLQRGRRSKSKALRQRPPWMYSRRKPFSNAVSSSEALTTSPIEIMTGQLAVLDDRQVANAVAGHHRHRFIDVVRRPCR